MADMEESARGIVRESCTRFLKGGEDLLNPDGFARQFGSVDVYDISEISINRNRTPGSLVSTDKIMLEKGNGHVGNVKERRIAQN